MDKNKTNLIEALKKEREIFKNNGKDTTDHDVTIEYLETGLTKENPDKFELLDAAINDYKCLCSDYLN